MEIERPVVSLTLLGGFSAAVDGVPVPETAWRLKKARELVKLLALAPGHRLHREQAMDVLWRDREPAAAANNLHQAIYVARRALAAGAITFRDEMLQLTADVDVDRLERAVADGDRRAVLALNGELLPENRYDDWASERRDELAALVAGLDAGPTLPADASSFIGRGRQLAELRALLRGTRLLTLAGTGGAGKTRLALELARGEGGAALVELGALSDPRLVQDAVAAALDVSRDALIDFLSGRSLLLVIDNCEHLLPATAALVETLLRAAPGLTIVATSREPLRLPGEVVFRVPSLEIPDPEQGLGPSELLGYEAVRLFVERARDAAPGFALDERNAAAVARICFRLDGLPLAIELAAARIGALAPEAIAERLDDRFHVLRGANRQRTLAATLEWSHDLLEPDERVLFRRLAVFAGGFELEAVEAVCGDVADVLARLVEKSLVVAGEGWRYSLLETVRMYARERLDEAGERAALAERHARWALALAEAERGSPRLDREAPNLRLAQDTLLERAPADALRLCVALLPFWLRRIDLHEAQCSFDEALAVERSAEGLLAAAAIDLRSGQLGRALAHAEESRALAPDAHAEWRALQFLGECGIATDDVDAALPWLERALELARREDFAAAEAIGVYSLGVARWIAGDSARAEELVARSARLFGALPAERIPSPVNISEIRAVFEDTLQPFAEISAGSAVAYVLANQAGIARERGDLRRARALLDESAARFELAGDEAGRAAVLVRRAYLELAAGAAPAARAALEAARELRCHQHDRRGLGLVLSGLGLIDSTTGEHRRAEAELAEARDIFRRAGDRWGLASTLWRTADLALERGRLDDAEAALHEALAVLTATQRERWIAHTLLALAEVALRRGDIEPALALLRDAHDRYAARGDALGVADAEQRMLRASKSTQRSTA
jgi:predicted ATPase